MSSNDIIKSVSKKLKYYFEVKRLEDGFDLSGPDCPKLDHPPMKARPTLMYDGLHDRPLKHYFSPHEVRAALTQFKPPENGEGREKNVRKKVMRQMRKQTFITPVLEDSFYVRTKKSKKLRPDVQGFGIPLKRSKPAHRGGYPVLRTVPSQHLSRGEANRLVNIASKLLVATETVDLKQNDSEHSGDSSNSGQLGERSKSCGAPRGMESKERLPRMKEKKSRGQRPKSTKGQRKVAEKDMEDGHNIYTYDMSGKRILLKTLLEEDAQEKKRKEEDAQHNIYTYDPHGKRVLIKKDQGNDSAYSTRPASANPAHQEGEEEDASPVKPWLRREMRKASQSRADDEDGIFGRPNSAPSKQPRPPSADRPLVLRPGSAKHHEKNTKNNYSSRAWDSQSSLSSKSSYSSSSSRSSSGSLSRSRSRSPAGEIAVQTGPELLDDYDSSERVIDDGEQFAYQVRVYTGKKIGASTHAEVRLVLIGDNGRTPDVHLGKSRTHKVKFQTGQEDIFDIECGDLGSLRRLCIGHDSVATRDGWYLEKVSIINCEQRKIYHVACDTWLSMHDGDGRTFKEFEVESATSYNGDLDKSLSITNDPHITPVPPKSPYATSNEPHIVPSTGPQLTENHTMDQPHHLNEYKKQSKSNNKSPTSITPAPQRRDDFFDQRVTEKDYSSVIESLSTTTDQDNQNDFASDKPDPSNTRYLQDRQDITKYGLPGDKDTARLSLGDIDSSKGNSTARGSVRDTEFLDGFQAGLEAAKKSQEVPVEPSVKSSRQDSTSEDESVKPRQGPSIHEAARTGDLEHLKTLTQSSPEAKLKPDERGWQPLHIAASNGQLETVQWLSINVVDLDVLTPTGYTPMHLAATNGHTNCMMVLAAMGAKIDGTSVDGRTPIHQAALSGHLESCKWLVANRANLDAVDMMGRTPLQMADEREHPDVINFLRACEEDKSKPDSSLAQLRSRTPSISNSSDAGHVSGGKQPSGVEGMELYGVPEEDERVSHDDRPATARLRVNEKHHEEQSGTEDSSEDSDSDDVSEAESDYTAGMTATQRQKHDEELMEKKKLYEKQQEDRRESSFLDSIREDY